MTAATTLTVTAFLLQRLDEQETAAINVTCFEVRDGIPGNYVIKDRVLAQVAALRAVVESVEFTRRRGTNGLGPSVLFHLAAIYKDHPNFDPAWLAS